VRKSRRLERRDEVRLRQVVEAGGTLRVVMIGTKGIVMAAVLGFG